VLLFIPAPIKAAFLPPQAAQAAQAGIGIIV